MERDSVVWNRAYVVWNQTSSKVVEDEKIAKSTIKKKKKVEEVKRVKRI